MPDAFVMRFASDTDAFADSFLASPDFDNDALLRIAHTLGFKASVKQKQPLINYIMSQIGGDRRVVFLPVITSQLFTRNREWMSIKVGQVTKFPVLATADELVFSTGHEEWYGPVVHPYDEPNAHWYVRPVLVPHWEKLASDERPMRKDIRWLCFARVTENVMSLHWRGFYRLDPTDGISNPERVRNSQFEYWEHVPCLFDELAKLTEAKVDYIDLRDLVLEKLWNQYLFDQDFSWAHIRIRAESGGVTLNAHAGAVYDLKAEGILNLAKTLRKAIALDLKEQYQFDIPDVNRLDQAIMHTLIKRYGARSYEFGLKNENRMLFKAHSFFGTKPDSNSQDLFPHLRVTSLGDIQQLIFLLNHLG